MSVSISTTSETLVVSIETDRGKLHSQADCWLLDVKGGAIASAPTLMSPNRAKQLSVALSSFVRMTGGGDHWLPINRASCPLALLTLLV